MIKLARHLSKKPGAVQLDAHGLLTTLANTSRNRMGRLPVGKQAAKVPVDGLIPDG